MAMYSVEEIKEIISAFDSSKATYISIKGFDGEKLTIEQKKENPTVDLPSVLPGAVEPAAQRSAEGAKINTEESALSGTDNKINDGRKPVNSPMVGVFYAAPAPDKDPYVTVGTKVKKGDILCLIEAMKLMNEITAEHDGEIVELCVENGQVVEFGQPLFMIKA